MTAELWLILISAYSSSSMSVDTSWMNMLLYVIELFSCDEQSDIYIYIYIHILYIQDASPKSEQISI